MGKYEWKKELELGHKDIDEQHKKLVGIIQAIETGIKNGIKKEEMVGYVLQLQLYATHHFQLEEKIMASLQFPDKSEHQKQHESFRVTIKEFQEELKRGMLRSSQVFSYLGSWLMRHIAVSDKRLGRWIDSINRT